MPDISTKIVVGSERQEAIGDELIDWLKERCQSTPEAFMSMLLVMMGIVERLPTSVAEQLVEMATQALEESIGIGKPDA